MAAEELSLARGEARIKFKCKWLGNIWEHVIGEEKEILENAIKELASKLPLSNF